MKFDAYAALAKLRADAGPRAKEANRANPSNSPSTISTGPASAAQTAAAAEMPACTVSPTAVSPAPPAAPLPQNISPIDGHDYLQSWTGRMVRLDEWERLSEWDRYGPAGRPFCGLCKAWVDRDGDCVQDGCWKAEGGAA